MLIAVLFSSRRQQLMTNIHFLNVHLHEVRLSDSHYGLAFGE